MHELGIVYHIMREVEDVARQNSIARVAGVTLQLGEVSGVVPELLQDAWRWSADRTDVCAGAELAIETLPARTRCNTCGEVYATVEHGRTCPACQSDDTELVCGQEIAIKEIEVSDEAGEGADGNAVSSPAGAVDAADPVDATAAVDPVDAAHPLSID